MEENSVEECVKCGGGVREDDPLSRVGAKYRGEGRNPLDTLIEYASQVNLDNLVLKLKQNKKTQTKNMYSYIMSYILEK